MCLIMSSIPSPSILCPAHCCIGGGGADWTGEGQVGKKGRGGAGGTRERGGADWAGKGRWGGEGRAEDVGVPDTISS